LKAYAKQARSDEGFEEYLAEHILGSKVAA
jgi:hypothetical protein